ncbi:DNA-3-methyladenine glycosylase 2 family protein [Streptomyces hirsutus]|uniref:DNA-3-methyladenine glycosylase 2 family protein n=1 Tax=Streptomyces hirsutus TaxID=35620 RepID=A0ABZ1GLE8_9ACTN|nr:DNA-3-methyladenine glycosylase 2 family protein [Streptomyces hirsutus]WSD06991.1 DNA-3-methyladenine glycosylase 2 family protein [Streptomyces hirsutus]WTD19596.1 DNA-3-methyladenine glycosylase 2 family protein [Streptomyces hirsutus]WTD75500.1 DNA-3-methyladenine glycosylase 2 family protein [Streptomyces sp. NBC_01635]
MAGRFAPRPTPRPASRPARTTVRGGRGADPTGVPRQAPAPASPPSVRTWEPEGPLDLGLVLGPLRRGSGDPTFRALPDGSVWRTGLTPAGPGTLRVTWHGDGVRGEAWGAGAGWFLDRLPDLLGAADDPAAFVPRHTLLALTRHRRPGLRLARTGLVLESLIPSVLEQKVTTGEAYRAWRLLVRKYGEPAPGPAPERMAVMPSPRTWALIPSWEWHRAGVDDKRASTVLRAVRVAARLEEAAGMAPAAARARLELVPGIGPWTSAETVQRSHGAPDEVTTGDLHLPGIVGWALAGDRYADDAAMLELLEPYAGQRHRAARLILLSGRTPARRAPKMPRWDIGRL